MGDVCPCGAGWRDRGVVRGCAAGRDTGQRRAARGQAGAGVGIGPDRRNKLCRGLRLFPAASAGYPPWEVPMPPLPALPSYPQSAPSRPVGPRWPVCRQTGGRDGGRLPRAGRHTGQRRGPSAPLARWSARAHAHKRPGAALERPPLGGMGGVRAHERNPALSRFRSLERFGGALKRVRARARLDVPRSRSHDPAPSPETGCGTVANSTR